MMPSTSLRFRSFVSNLRRASVFSIGFRSKWGGMTGRFAKRPFAALDFVFLGRRQLEQVPDRRREHVIVAFKIVVVTLETAQRARDITGHGRLFGNDQFFPMSVWSDRRLRWQDAPCQRDARGRSKRAPDDKNKPPAAQATGQMRMKLRECRNARRRASSSHALITTSGKELDQTVDFPLREERRQLVCAHAAPRGVSVSISQGS